MENDLTFIGKDGVVEFYYSEKYNNAKIVAIGDRAFVGYNYRYYSPSNTAWDGFFAKVGEHLIGTGYVMRSANNNYIQTTTGYYVPEYYIKKDGWNIQPNTKKINYSTQNTQKVINETIKNNKRIIENNLFCARYAYKLSQDERKLLYDLQVRLQNRDNNLKNPKYIESYETATPAGYSQLSPSLDQFMNTGGVGSATVAIVIAVLLIATFAGVCYFSYKNLYDESKEDVKFSDELTATLKEKLTPEEYEQLEKETQGIVTRAKINQKLKSSKSWIKTVAICAAIIGGVLLIRKRG